MQQSMDIVQQSVEITHQTMEIVQQSSEIKQQSSKGVYVFLTPGSGSTTNNWGCIFL